jgi:replicative DNA helicase
MSEREAPPPSNLEAETSVIGAVLLDASNVARLSWITPEMFTHPGYALAWRVMNDLTSEGIDVDILTVTERMKHIKYGAEYSVLLNQSVTHTASSEHARQYGAMVLKAYQQRQLLELAQYFATQAYSTTDPAVAGQQGMTTLSHLLALSPAHTTGRKTYSEVLDLLHEDTYTRAEKPDMTLKTGFARIDAWSGGFEPGQFILIAGRPGSGKSALALSMARRFAGRFHHQGAGAVDVVTMEMSMLSQARRIVAARGLPVIDTRLIRTGFRDEQDEFDGQAYSYFMEMLEADRAEVGDALAFHEGVMTTDQLAVIAQDAKTNHGMQVLIIDQLDLFADTNRNGEYERVTNISRKLKQLAMRLGIIIICLVQLNREVEKRGDKRPQLSDLRQSGQLEQDADIVMALYRPAYYFPPIEDWPEKTNEVYAQWAELLTLKFRDGQADVLTPLCFQGAAASYTDWDGDAYPIGDIRNLVAGREKMG